MENKELEAKIEEVHKDIRDGYTDMSNYTSTLFLFLDNGKTKILDIEYMSRQGGISPGQIMDRLKPRIRKDQTVIGTMFTSEAWTVSTNLDGPATEDAKAVMAGDKTPSECDSKEEVVIFNIATRGGYDKLYKHRIIRDYPGAQGRLEIDDTPLDMGEGEGNLTGIFK